MKAKNLFIYSLFIIISMLICFGVSTKYNVYAVNGDNNTLDDDNNNGTVDPNLNDDDNNNDVDDNNNGINNDDNNDNDYNDDNDNDELDTAEDNDLASNLLYAGGGTVLGALITYFSMKDRH